MKVLRVVSLLIICFISTWFIVRIHTPKFTEITFDFSCPASKLPCQATISDEKRSNFKSAIATAEGNSHRLGKLSDVYLSVIEGDLKVRNIADLYISYSATNGTLQFPAGANCGNQQLLSGQEYTVGENIALSDDADTIYATPTFEFISSCTGNFLQPDDAAKLPPIPPNDTVKFETGPRFEPFFEPDYLSWILIFVFNFLILLGLLPLFREGYDFVRKGFRYFVKK